MTKTILNVFCETRCTHGSTRYFENIGI